MSQVIEVTDIKSNTTTYYNSFSAAVRALDIWWKDIKNYLSNN